MTTPPPRDWVSFTEDDGTVWMFDATFLMSSWTCIFGNGCQGVLDHDATDLNQGCCSFGAHFADAEDRTRVRATIGRLRKDQWQHKRTAKELGGAIAKNDNGDWVTRTVDGACIMLNRPGFEGGSGCALHSAAIEVGERPLDWKPDVCWQLPLRLETRVDDNDRTTYILREWERRDWGEGGQEFHWWCTEAPEAFISHRKVHEELADEIVELIGEGPYQWFREHIASRPDSRILPHPTVRVRPG